MAAAFGKVTFSEQTEELSLKSTLYTDEDTVFRINYWEIPSRVRSSDYVFRYSIGSAACIYLFDVTSRQSFDNLEKWFKDNEKAEIPLKVLVGNKVDQFNAGSKTVVQKQEANAFAKKHGM
jgi:GTPase SAR1 family protein